MLLRAEGYSVLLAATAGQAEDVVVELAQPPDLIISDYHLLDESTGVQAVVNVRSVFDTEIPAFIVSGDTSRVVQDAKQVANSVLLAKPVHSDGLLARARAAISTGRADGV
ncbi:MAG: hypothetical protein U5K76_02000 [Woeseiaceae bacterium]|nr:hypothetical protein [Woeseiaceae bacterium]